jgi:hypothetical protein
MMFVLAEYSWAEIAPHLHHYDRNAVLIFDVYELLMHDGTEPNSLL